jgi:hypothetical protein
MRIVRWFFGLLFLLALGAGVAYFLAGRADGPAITINQPSVIWPSRHARRGRRGSGAVVTALDINWSRRAALFRSSTWHRPQMTRSPEGDRLRVTRPVGKSTLPELESGPATMRVSAARRCFTD